ncbi:dehydrogenase/reductase SDR family protein 7-like [Venturia canescens]|uniref:dehydrogenase/reductase SDR family protein 7-like n=1 Tax=Venturia canescens TaxID=32260 RepID=UPI001C9D566A|nr:dehydrogenase/reductase SDR family protein 7-like [Venturia canescens]
MKQHENLKGWPLVWWLFTLFGIPVTFPWLLYHLVDFLRNKRRKAALHSKVVLITGASSGLGEALAHTFYSCGCRIILVARRKEELERVKNSLMETHHTAPTHPPIVLPLDLTDINSLPAEIDKVLTIHGQIDLLINNAGISYRGEVVSTNVNVDIKVMLVNYFAQIALSKAVLPSMISRQTGHIVCVSSVQGKIAIPYRSAYAASKHALQAWSDSTRAELADKNVKITVVNPGYIRTSLSLNALTGDGQNYGVMDKTLQEGYTPEYVARRILTAVLKEEKEIMISPITPKAATFLRYIWPSLYFKIMERRAKKKVE